MLIAPWWHLVLYRTEPICFVNHALPVVWESLTSCLCLQKCKCSQDSWDIKGLIHKDQAQEYPPPKSCLSFSWKVAGNKVVMLFRVHTQARIPTQTIKRGHQVSGAHYKVPQSFSLNMDLMTSPSGFVFVP